MRDETNCNIQTSTEPCKARILSIRPQKSRAISLAYQTITSGGVIETAGISMAEMPAA